MAHRGIVLAVVVCATAAAAAADDLPFEIQNARKAGITDRVQIRPDGTAVWSYTARVVVAGAGGEKDAKDLAVDFQPLEAERGARSSDTRAGLPAQLGKLAPGQSIELGLTAAFSQVGDYHGELVLYQGNVQRVVPVAIKVEDPSVTDASLVEHGRAIIALDDAWDGEAETSVQVELRNTGTHELLLAAPRVVAARRVDKLDKPTRESQIATAGIAPDKIRAVGRVGPGDVKPIQLDLAGLDDPGVYQVDVQVPVIGHTPRAVDVTVYRRKHWSRALLWIALGVVGAYGVRRFVQGGKDRMKVRRTLAALAPRLDAVRAEAVDPAYVAAAMVLGAELDQRRRDVGWQADGAALLDTAERLAARVELLGEIIAAARTVARLDGNTQVEPRKAIEAALAVVRVDPGAAKAADIDDQRRKIAGLGIEGAWQAKLRAAVTELRRSIDALAATAEAGVRDKLNALRPVVARAQGALDRNELSQSAAAVDELRPTFLAIAVDDLRARIQDVPLGATAGEWQKVISAVQNQLDIAGAEGEWAARRDAFAAGQRAYFQAAITALIAHARAHAADTQHPASDPARLRAIGDELSAEIEAGDAGIDRAARIYATRVAEVEVAARPQGGVTRVAAGFHAQGVPWIGIPGETAASGTPVVPQKVRAIDAQIRATDWLVTGAVLAVALASGIKALWLPNLAWGVEGDALTALLWGAGVGAVGDAFTGLAGLREKLGSAA